MSGWRHLCALALLVTLAGAPRTPTGRRSLDRCADRSACTKTLTRHLSAPALRGAYVGLLAIDTVRGTELYSRNADDEFTPGSNFKLLVGSAALRYLGPGFRFVTTLSSDVPRKDGVVSGNLYLHGGGDAHLRAADLRAAALAAFWTGIRHVDGAVIVDASHDDAQGFAPGWTLDDLPYEYAALVSALELEDGVVHVYVSPGAVVGAPVKLRVEPASGAFTVENRAITGVAHSQDSTDVVRPLDSPQRIEIVGSYPAGAPESDDLEPSVPDPELYAGDVLLRALGDAGITVAGGSATGVAPRSARVFWRLESRGDAAVALGVLAAERQSDGRALAERTRRRSRGRTGQLRKRYRRRERVSALDRRRSVDAIDHGRLRSFGVRSDHAARSRDDSAERLERSATFDSHRCAARSRHPRHLEGRLPRNVARRKGFRQDRNSPSRAHALGVPPDRRSRPGHVFVAR